MKKISKKWIKIAFVAFAISTTLLSCSKEDLPPQKEVESVKVVNVTDLKNYMAKLINVNVDDIGYDQKKEIFLLNGTEQIDRENLTKFYLVAKKK